MGFDLQITRVDPADGKAYPLDSFLEIYGENEGHRRWVVANQQPSYTGISCYMWYFPVANRCEWCCVSQTCRSVHLLVFLYVRLLVSTVFIALLSCFYVALVV